MSKIEQLIDINRKLSNISYTNSESLELIKDSSAINFVKMITDCNRNNQGNAEFLKCFLVGSCPDELSNFQICQTNNSQNVGLCGYRMLELENCVRKYPNKVLSILEKTNKFI